MYMFVFCGYFLTCPLAESREERYITPRCNQSNTIFGESAAGNTTRYFEFRFRWFMALFRLYLQIGARFVYPSDRYRWKIRNKM